MSATIRRFLDSCGFDWASGTIIVQMVREEHSSPGWASEEDIIDSHYINPQSQILDIEFDNGLGGPECPRYIAEDKDKIYFPSQYDGATGPEFVYKDIKKYSDKNNLTPYPGG
uniref:Uncharacterized protein n=1 Tax=viral metagenome TaxID=1070528 RepID=A0A6M3Y0R6_9ZZZZ